MKAARRSRSRQARGPKRLSARGSRVYLRVPTAADEEEFLALRRASRRFHSRWEAEPPRGVDPYGPRAFQAYLDQGAGTRRERWLVCLRENDALAGSFTISEIRRGVLQSAQLGYWVGKEYARQGLMHEALALVLRHAFVDLALHRIEANLQPENAPSRALIAGAGFRLEGCSPGFAKLRGRWREHERWALLAEEWRAQRRRSSQRPQSRR